MKKKKQIALIILQWIVIAFLLVAFYFGYMFYKEYTGKSAYQGEEDVEIVIKQGMGTKKIAKLLKENGLIRFEYSFILKAMENGKNKALRYGTFLLKKGMNLEEIIETLTKGGDSKETVTITIPEGYTIEMIGKKLEKENICTAKEFYQAALESYDYWFLKGLPNNKQIKYRIQGFLFPDTYQIYQDSTATDIIKAMLEGFSKQVTEKDKKQAEKLGYNLYEIITMASIVEREAKLDEERPTIAGVIYNRLNQDMKLQMCPTVLYITTDGMYNVNQVLYKDLEVDSTYNTYFYKGLPAGPICNPGKKSIEAVLNPEEHSYLFYHTDDETIGNHIFTETYQEHEDTRIKK